MEEDNEKQPWYKSDGFLTIICIFLPPIGYLIILSNKKKWGHDRYIGMLAVATFTMALWLIKFLPGEWGTIIFLTGAAIYGVRKLQQRMKKK